MIVARSKEARKLITDYGLLHNLRENPSALRGLAEGWNPEGVTSVVPGKEEEHLDYLNGRYLGEVLRYLDNVFA